MNWKHSVKGELRVLSSELSRSCIFNCRVSFPFRLLEDIYADDIEQFNDPSTTENTVNSFTDPNFTCPRWLRELYKVAPQVKRLPKQKSKTKKRKRVILEDDDEAGPHDNGAPQDEDQVRGGAGGAGPSGEGVSGEGGAGGSGTGTGTGEQPEES